MQPQVLFGADICDFAYGIYRRSGGCADGSGHTKRKYPCGAVFLNSCLQRFRIHLEGPVCGDFAHTTLANAERDGRLFYGRVCLF